LCCATCIHLEALDSAFEEHEEGGVWIDGLPLLKDGLGFPQAGLRLRAVQGEEGLHHRVIPQEGQAVRAGQWRQCGSRRHRVVGN